MKNVQTTVVVFSVFLIAGVGGLYFQRSGIDLTSTTEEHIPGVASSPNQDVIWPPQVGQVFPDLKLTSIDGQQVRLSDFRGRVLIIEAVGMSCKACVAFSGGHAVGPFDGHKPQPGLESFESYFHRFAGLGLADDRLEFIQILFYGPDGRRAPTQADAQRWAHHFGSILPDNATVLFADDGMVGRQTGGMIPGFQLVDRNFVLRCDAGKPPRQDLYREFLPTVRSVLDEIARERFPVRLGWKCRITQGGVACVRPPNDA